MSPRAEETNHLIKKPWTGPWRADGSIPPYTGLIYSIVYRENGPSADLLIANQLLRDSDLDPIPLKKTVLIRTSGNPFQMLKTS